MAGIAACTRIAQTALERPQSMLRRIAFAAIENRMCMTSNNIVWWWAS